MMQYPPSDHRISKEEHAARLARYHARIKLALIRYRAWQIKNGLA